MKHPAFAKERHAYGSPIIDYQMIQAMLADSVNDLWASRLMTYEAARGIAPGDAIQISEDGAPLMCYVAGGDEGMEIARATFECILNRQPNDP